MTDTPDADFGELLAELVRFLTLEPAPGEWAGQPPEWDWSGDYLFGGLVVAQALMAASRNAPASTRIHSMHGYFLRPVRSDAGVDYRVTDLRRGRNFTTRRLQATQGDKAVFDMTYSLTSDADVDGYVYDLPAPATFPELDDGAPTEPGPGPWESVRWARARLRKPAPGSPRTGCGSVSRATCPTTRTSTRLCSASPVTGPASAAGHCTWRATHWGW